ncbi:hypothetical protein GUJ93_ZPchr0002g26344 [Zizania palustris]|uniref:Uncharacterized protein n=1 Tax=Zizania palustris TaxID=103762 RepID=A0A8J5VU93_ZIZPA|nr:hypothetical protein GUJ93_ZPchr0002g26344 [Zizania palustris]
MAWHMGHGLVRRMKRCGAAAWRGGVSHELRNIEGRARRYGMAMVGLNAAWHAELGVGHDIVGARHGNDSGGSGDSSSCKTVDSDHQKVITNIDAADRDYNNLEVQTQVPTHTRREPTYLELLLKEEDFELPPYVPNQESNQYSSPTWIDHEPAACNDVIETAELEPQEHITSAGTCSHFLVPLAEVKQDSSQVTGHNSDHLGVGRGAYDGPPRQLRDTEGARDGGDVWQRDIVVAAAMRHIGMLTMYAPGRNLVVQVNKLLAARGRKAMQLLSAPTFLLYFHG